MPAGPARISCLRGRPTGEAVTQRPNARSTETAARLLDAGMEIIHPGLAPLPVIAAALVYSGLMILAMRR